jgi:hypothetical protein
MKDLHGVVSALRREKLWTISWTSESLLQRFGKEDMGSFTNILEWEVVQISQSQIGKKNLLKFPW